MPTDPKKLARLNPNRDDVQATAGRESKTIDWQYRRTPETNVRVEGGGELMYAVVNADTDAEILNTAVETYSEDYDHNGEPGDLDCTASIIDVDGNVHDSLEFIVRAPVAGR